MNVRFASITPVNVSPVSSGTVTGLYEEDGQRCAVLALQTTANGVVTLQGEAVVVLS